MSYVKTTWSNGDTITADKLNHMETGIYDASQGGGGGGSSDVTYIMFRYNNDTGTFECDKTFSEIVTLIEDGSIFIAYFNLAGAYMSYNTIGDEQGIVKIKFVFVNYGQLSENDYGLTISTIEMDSNNEITPDASQYVLTPFVSP